MKRLWLLPLAVIVAILPFVAGESYLFSFFILVGTLAIACMGLDLAFGYGGQLSLGHGAFMSIGAYGSAILTTRYGVPPLAAMAAAAVLTAVIATGIGIPILGLLSHFQLAIATLAFGVLVFSYLVVGGEFTGGYSGIFYIPPFSIGGLTFDTELKTYYLVWGFVFLLLILGLNLAGSQSGRAMKALRDDELAAAVMGTNVTRYKIKVFALSAVYSSMAGSLMVHHLKYVTPTLFDVVLSFDLVTMVVLGGKATLVGGIFGAAFLKLLPQFTEFFKDYRLLSNGILLVLLLIFFPGGIMAMVSIVYRRLSERLVRVRGAGRAAGELRKAPQVELSTAVDDDT